MEVGGEVYLGEVREKEEAWRLYKEAVDQGTAAGTLHIISLAHFADFLILGLLRIFFFIFVLSSF